MKDIKYYPDSSLGELAGFPEPTAEEIREVAAGLSKSRLLSLEDGSEDFVDSWAISEHGAPEPKLSRLMTNVWKYGKNAADVERSVLNTSSRAGKSTAQEEYKARLSEDGSRVVSWGPTQAYRDSAANFRNKIEKRRKARKAAKKQRKAK